MTNSKFEIFLDKVARNILYYSPFRHFVLYKYRYAFDPLQYGKLISLLDAAAKLEGDFVEVGCYRGYTTVYLNKYIDLLGHQGRYLAIDTFGGFTKSSVDFEISNRNKQSKEERRSLNKFTVNSKKWFDETMKLNGISRVTSIQEEAENLDSALSETAKICFALIDVDLYQPTLSSLEAIYEKVTPGGYIIIDDCAKDHAYDGSREALEEFCEAKNIQFEIMAGKLGVIKVEHRSGESG